jgi:hypothetical protein
MTNRPIIGCLHATFSHRPSLAPYEYSGMCPLRSSRSCHMFHSIHNQIAHPHPEWKRQRMTSSSDRSTCNRLPRCRPRQAESGLPCQSFASNRTKRVKANSRSAVTFPNHCARCVPNIAALPQIACCSACQQKDVWSEYLGRYSCHTCAMRIQSLYGLFILAYRIQWRCLYTVMRWVSSAVSVSGCW